MSSKHPAVTIPRTPLGAELEKAAQIQREMTQLLRELEAGAHIKPGSWRHRPT
jgi:hypothetical protein